MTRGGRRALAAAACALAALPPAACTGAPGDASPPAVAAQSAAPATKPAAAPFVPPTLTLRPAPALRIESPVGSDCNRPSWWVGDTFYQMVSNQHAWRSRGGADARSAGDFQLARFADDAPSFGWDARRRWYVHDINAADRPTATPMRWMESVYRRPDTGVLYGLYHLEEGPYVRCPAPFERPYLSVPHIGLAESTDGGLHWRNLGLVLSDGTFPVTCASPVRFFTGGVGDPSMAVDAEGRYAYIAFTSYSGDDPSRQGIQLARIAVADLGSPLRADGTSKVLRWYGGRWAGPGLQGESPARVGQRWPATPVGQATPLLPPARSWQRPDGGGYWGPSLSWNTHLGAFVLLLNNVSGAREFDAEGNYITYVPDMADPRPVPAAPIKLNALPGGPEPRWYVQALGDPRERGTSARTGQDARLFLGDRSDRLLHFGPAAPPR